MLRNLFQSSATTASEVPRVRRMYAAIAVLVALAMFVAASGSGSDVEGGGLPDWIDLAANLVSAAIGIMVLIPRTRAYGGLLAALNMGLSAVTNFSVDGFEYALKVLPYNLVTAWLGIVLFRHFRADPG